MRIELLAACAAFAVSLLPLSGHASGRATNASETSLPRTFVDFFYRWKSQPQDLQVSELRVLNAGGDLRLLCGAYDLPGKPRQPFLVMGDDRPTASAAWEPGSFPESDPLYPQLMDNLRLCQRLGEAVTAAHWGKPSPPPQA